MHEYVSPQLVSEQIAPPTSTTRLKEGNDGRKPGKPVLYDYIPYLLCNGGPLSSLNCSGASEIIRYKFIEFFLV